VEDHPEEINAIREGFSLLTHSNESRKLQIAWKAFNSIFFHHVYGDRNVDVDRLSKVGFHLHAGVWIIQEKVEGQFTEYFHDPFT
jgi:hypothetical protein